MSSNMDDNNKIDYSGMSESDIRKAEEIMEASKNTQVNLDDLDFEKIQDMMDPDIREKISRGEVPPEVQEVLTAFTDEVGKQLDEGRRCEVAKKLLEEKYQKEFEIVRYRGQDITDDHYAVDAYEKSYPYMVFEARVKLDEKSVSDSYATHLGCRMIKERISQNMDEVQGNYDIYVESWILFANINDVLQINEKTLANAIPNNKYAIHLFFETGERKTNITEEDFQKMLTGLEEYRGYIKLFVVTKEEKKKIFEYIEERSKLYTSYWEMTKENYLGRFAFSEGKVNVDRELLNKLLEKM